MAEKRRKKWKLVLTVVIALLIIMAVVAHVPTGPVKIITSHETTVINGPLNPDGTVNYLAALEAEYAAGVTPENNAAVLLLKAVGLSVLTDQYKTLNELGLTVEDITSDRYFVRWRERASFMAATVVKDAAGRPLEIYDVMDNLAKGQVHPDLEAWLEANAEPLRLVGQASRRPRYYMPMVAASHPPVLVETLLPMLSWARDLAKALDARAALRCHSGDVDGAWEDVLTAHRLARLMQQGPTIVQQLVAIAIERVAAEAGIELATREGLTAEKADQLLAQLASLKPVGDVVGCVDRSERFVFLDVVMTLSRGTELDGLSGEPVVLTTSGLDWNHTLRVVNKWHDQLVASMRLPRFKGRAGAKKAFDDDLMRLASRTKSKGHVARRFLLPLGGRPFRRALTRDVTDVLIIMLMPTLSKAHEIQDEVRTRSDMEKLAIALAWSKAEKGRFPAKLAELAPRYLPTIPADRFSPDPLIYRAKDGGYIVYSVGMNLRDDGGVTDRAAEKDDIAAEAKPAEPEAK